MNEKVARQIEEMKKQTIGVEVEMNNITREKAAKVAEEGRIAQKKFFDLLCSGISQEEMKMYERITEKMAANIMGVYQRKKGE